MQANQQPHQQPYQHSQRPAPPAGRSYNRPRNRYATEDDRKAARRATKRLSAQRSRARQRLGQSEQGNSHQEQDGLRIEIDSLSILQRAGPEADVPIAAPALGIQAEGLNVPVDAADEALLEAHNDLSNEELYEEAALSDLEPFVIADEDGEAIELAPAPAQTPTPPLRTEPIQTRSRSRSQASAVRPTPTTTNPEQEDGGANTGNIGGGAAEEAVDIAAELATQLLRFHGCEVGQHERVEQAHDDRDKEATQHLSLADFVDEHGELPDTISSPHLLAKGSISSDDAEEWKHAYLGTTEDDPRTPREVCIYCSDQHYSPLTPAASYDIDSIMGLPSSLAFARQGIRINLAPQTVSNIESDVHLRVPVPIRGGGNRNHVPLHTVPHYHLGKLAGREDVAVYLLFPALYERSQTNSFLTQETLKRWTDRVLLPALYSLADAATLQHYPASWEHSKLSSRAAHTESHARLNKAGSHHQQIHHYVEASLLEEMWNIILRTAEEDGFHDFRGVQIFFSGKNLKAHSKRASLLVAWDHFFSQLEPAINLDYIHPNQFWVDVGKETCAPQSFLYHQNAGGQLAETYLWRPCCLDSYWRWSHHGYPSRPSHRSTYNTALLRDATGMTILTPPRSPSRQQGLVYSQFYTSQKEIFDANKTFPFHDAALESLALDPTIRAGWQRAGYAENHRETTLVASYLASKTRCHAAMRDSTQKSFGTREEHRITLTLGRNIRSWLDGPDAAAVQSATPPPRPFWRLSTLTFLGFVRANINKFTTGFEYVRSIDAHSNYVSWERSQAMIMFIRLLKYGSGSHQLQREIALWYDTRLSRSTGEELYGIGFATTVSQYGYGWFLPKLDWESFTFLPELPGRNLFGNIRMVEAFKKRWRAVREAVDDFLVMNQLGRSLQDRGNDKDACDSIIFQMAYTCLRAFRKDVLSSIQRSIRPEFVAEATKGEFTLCYSNLQKILLPEAADEEVICHVAVGNKMKFKGDPTKFINFLWGFDDSQSRTHWEKKSYRALYKTALRLADDHGRRDHAELLKLYVTGLFPILNWVVPYPNKDVFWQHTKQSNRMWLSLYNSRVARASTAGGTMSFEEVLSAARGGSWKIGRGARPVLQCTLSDKDLQRRVGEGVPNSRELVLHKPRQDDRHKARQISGRPARQVDRRRGSGRRGRAERSLSPRSTSSDDASVVSDHYQTPARARPARSIVRVRSDDDDDDDDVDDEWTDAEPPELVRRSAEVVRRNAEVVRRHTEMLRRHAGVVRRPPEPEPEPMEPGFVEPGFVIYCDETAT